MSSRRQSKEPQRPVAAPSSVPRLDEATFQRLVEEGQALRRAFDARTAPMRHITSEDLKFRSR